MKRIAKRIAVVHTRDMNATTHTKAGIITVKGRPRMAFRRDAKVMYFPHIRAKAIEANADDAATWED